MRCLDRSIEYCFLSLTAILFLLPLAGCGLLQQLGGFQRPTMRLKSLHLADVSFSAMTLDFEFEVDNPNSVGLTLASLDYQLDIERRTLLKGNQPQQVKIAAKKASPVRLPLTIEFAQFVESLAVFFSSKDQVPYRLKAGFGLDTPVGTMRIPLDVDGHVPLPRLPSVSVAGLTLAKMGLTGADVHLTLDVANKNKFPVRINGAQYGIAVGGVEVSQGQAQIPTLAADQTAAITVPLHLDFRKLGASLVQVIKDQRLPYRVQGALDLGVLKHPFDLSGEARFD